jgi:hypothetical protein
VKHRYNTVFLYPVKYFLVGNAAMLNPMPSIWAVIGLLGFFNGRQHHVNLPVTVAMAGYLQTRFVNLQHQAVKSALAACRRYAVVILFAGNGVNGIVRLVQPAGFAAEGVAVKNFYAFYA